MDKPPFTSKKIDCILSDKSQYHVLQYFTNKVAQALRRAGHTVRALTVQEYRSEYKQNLPDMTLGFNGGPQDEKGEYYCDKVDVPHAALLVDMPIFYLGIVKSPNIRIYCDDETNIKLLTGFGCNDALFLTQGVEPELIDENIAEKEYDIVFFGSYFGIERAKAVLKASFSPKLYEFIESAIALSLTDDTLDIMTALNKVIVGNSELLVDVDLTHLIYGMSFLQKGIARTNLLNSLKNFPVHVWDARWKQALNDSTHLIIHEAVDYQDSLKILKKSKISLCNSIRSVNGCNERVLNALACGALPVTNTNPYFRRHFQDSKQLLMYSNDTLGSLEEKVRLYLDNDQLRNEIIQNGKKEIALHHTWDERIKSLIIP